MVGKLWRAGPGSVAVKATAYEFVVNVITAMVAGKRMQQEEVRPSSITPRAGVETRNASASKGQGRLIYFSACVQVLRLKAMTEAAHAATGAANRHDFIPVLRLLDLGRTARKLAALAKERHQFGQSLVDDYRRRRHPRSSASEAETPRTVIGDLLREQPPRREPRAARERDVVGGEALARGGRGGDEEDRPRAEAEEEEAAGAPAVARGEGAVQRLLQKVEVADNGASRRARDAAPAMAAVPAARVLAS